MRVLVVEDDTAAGEALARYLELNGHVVLLAHHGKAALAAAGKFRPDVLLTDWRLDHELDGVEVARRLQETFADLVTLLISAYPQSSLRQAASGLHNTKVLSKPLSLRDLIRTLDEQH